MQTPFSQAWGAASEAVPYEAGLTFFVEARLAAQGAGAALPLLMGAGGGTGRGVGGR